MAELCKVLWKQIEYKWAPQAIPQIVKCENFEDKDGEGRIAAKFKQELLSTALLWHRSTDNKPQSQKKIPPTSKPGSGYVNLLIYSKSFYYQTEMWVFNMTFIKLVLWVTNFCHVKDILCEVDLCKAK